jgi:4-amino-4-deoxy-L-arabinose transferase-like glycosyltransferase
MIARLRLPVALALLLALVAGGAVFAVYRLAPPAWTVEIGGPLSGALLDSGFYADEAEQAGRYRWTHGAATLTFADIGANSPLLLRFRASAPARPADAPPPVLTLTVASRVVATYTLTAQPAVYTTPPIPRPPDDPGLQATFNIPTFTPGNGDTRDLGMKLEWVRVEPAPGAPAPTPPAAVLLEAVLITLGLYGALARPAPWRSILAALLALAALALVMAGLAVARPLLTPWLPEIAFAAAGLGLLVVGWPVWRRWPAGLDSLAAPRSLAAPLILAVILVGYAAFALNVIPQIDWIGHADYADNAVVARNLAEGRGPVIDYVPQFYRFFPGITHPAETWPLLQPLLITPFFLLLGAQTWVAKLPNLFVLLALAVAVYHFAGRWWDRRVALLAAVLTLLHPYFFQTVLYPINDLSFTLLALLTIGWAWEALEATVARARRQVAQAAEEDDGAAPAARRPPPVSALPPASPTRPAILAGIAAGLLVWSKGPSAGLIIVGLLLGLAWGWRTGRWAGRRPPRDWQPLLWGLGSAALVVAPLLARNFLTFGKPFHSTEEYDLWILRFWTGGTGLPWENIYADYLDGRPLPDRSLLLHSYQELYTAVRWGFDQIWTGGIVHGDIVDLPVFVAGLAGWLLIPARLRGLRTAWVGAFVVYGLFVLLAWHYEPRYFLALAPWFYLGTAAALFWIWDHLRGRAPDSVDPAAPPAVRARRAGPVAAPLAGRPRASAAALAVLPLAVVALLWPALTDIATRATGDAGPDNFAIAGRWAAANLPADAVVMTRNPWEFNWYAQRKAVMIPMGPLSDVQAIIQRYGVTYIWLGGPGDPTNLRNPPARPVLDALYRRRPDATLPATLVYDQNGYLIYRLSP